MPLNQQQTVGEQNLHDTPLYIETCNSICEEGIPSSYFNHGAWVLYDGSYRSILVKIKSESRKLKIFSNLYKLRTNENSNISMIVIIWQEYKTFSWEGQTNVLRAYRENS